MFLFSCTHGNAVLFFSGSEFLEVVADEMGTVGSQTELTLEFLGDKLPKLRSSFPESLFTEFRGVLVALKVLVFLCLFEFSTCFDRRSTTVLFSSTASIFPVLVFLRKSIVLSLSDWMDCWTTISPLRNFVS